MKKIKGYKVFNSDWTCRGFKYEIGKEYKIDCKPEICSSGFHFCEKICDCFSYYAFDPQNKVAIVYAVGDFVKSEDDSKISTNKIKISKQISWEKVLELSNSGFGNSGYLNSGNGNSGCGNSGDKNSGDWNSGDWNSGVFNTKKHPIFMFNKISNITLEQWRGTRAAQILSRIMNLTEWVDEKNMSDKDKRNHPNFFCMKGYLKTYSYKNSCKKMWSNLSESNKEEIKNIENFDKELFKEITGIDV